MPLKVKGGRGKQGTQRVSVSMGHSTEQGTAAQAEQKLRSSICRCSFELLYCSLYLEICIWHPEWERAAQGRSATGYHRGEGRQHPSYLLEEEKLGEGLVVGQKINLVAVRGSC